VVEIHTLLKPPYATTSISNYWRLDVNGDGKINDLDLDLIIYNYYNVGVGGSKWDQAKNFDVNNDGIVDLADLLIITTYFTA
jgi:hypothetical protein